MEIIKLLEMDCTLQFAFYCNNTIAMEAYTIADEEPWCVPTVNYEQFFQGTDYSKCFQFPAVVIKNYSENEGVYDDLVAAGVIQHGPYLAGSGGTVLAALLTEKWQHIAKEQLHL